MSDLPTDQITAELLTALTEEIRGLRTDVRESTQAVRDERRGRRSNRILGAVAIVVLLLGLLVGAKAYVDSGRISCSTRAESRSDIRSAIAAGVDESARFAHLSKKLRSELDGRVERRVAGKLPPPTCQ